MDGDVTIYFDGEKNAGLMLAGIGLALLIGAAALFPARWGLRPFAITLAVCAVLKLAIGIGLYFKSGPQAAQALAQLARDASAFYAVEGPRMAIVQRNFVWIEAIWGVIIVSALGVALWRKEQPLISGIALGSMLGAALLLPFDIIAERRGKAYFAALDAASRSLPAPP